MHIDTTTTPGLLLWNLDHIDLEVEMSPTAMVSEQVSEGRSNDSEIIPSKAHKRLVIRPQSVSSQDSARIRPKRSSQVPAKLRPSSDPAPATAPRLRSDSGRHPARIRPGSRQAPAKLRPRSFAKLRPSSGQTPSTNPGDEIANVSREMNAVLSTSDACTGVKHPSLLEFHKHYLDNGVILPLDQLQQVFQLSYLNCLAVVRIGGSRTDSGGALKSTYSLAIFVDDAQTLFHGFPDALLAQIYNVAWSQLDTDA